MMRISNMAVPGIKGTAPADSQTMEELLATVGENGLEGIQHYFWKTIESEYHFDAKACSCNGEQLKVALCGVVEATLACLSRPKAKHLHTAFTITRGRGPIAPAPYLQEAGRTISQAIAGMSPHYSDPSGLAQKLIGLAVSYTMETPRVPGLYEKPALVQGMARQISDMLEFMAFGLIYQPESN
ncbi:MAG: hypothetical protein H6557_21255 [Lewinellaceae bacterium]|nr:hypothetical protein [Phaeodactylibacter sp.]MCB9039147.1 hypothetical protein [Lewinellaceae bacterium]